MLYNSASDWESSKSKRVMLFGMSGLGKTYISEMLRNNGDWFHYSIDYRIGTRYMGEHIADNFKKEAMRTPFLAELLQSDAIYIAANMKFSDLSPLSTYLENLEILKTVVFRLQNTFAVSDYTVMQKLIQ